MNITNFQIIKTILIVCFVFTLLALISCGKADDPIISDCNSQTWAIESQDELDAWIEASDLFEDDPSKANCESEKQAIMDFINSLEEYRDCTPALFKPDVDHNINKAKEALDETVCN